MSDEFKVAGNPAFPPSTVPIRIHHDVLGRTAVSAPVESTYVDGNGLLVVTVKLKDIEAEVEKREQNAHDGFTGEVQRQGRRADNVPTAPFRARVEELLQNTEETYASIARRAGFFHKTHLSAGVEPDTARLKKMLGTGNKTITYDNAVTLAAALECDPVDLGF